MAVRVRGLACERTDQAMFDVGKLSHRDLAYLGNPSIDRFLRTHRD